MIDNIVARILQAEAEMKKNMQIPDVVYITSAKWREIPNIYRDEFGNVRIWGVDVEPRDDLPPGVEFVVAPR